MNKEHKVFMCFPFLTDPKFQAFMLESYDKVAITVVSTLLTSIIRYIAVGIIFLSLLSGIIEAWITGRWYSETK